MFSTQLLTRFNNRITVKAAVFYHILQGRRNQAFTIAWKKGALKGDYLVSLFNKFTHGRVVGHVTHQGNALFFDGAKGL